MKKIYMALLFGLLLASPALAIITTDEASSPEYLINHGYSPEIARLVNYQDAVINGSRPTYFGVKPVRWTTKYKSVNFIYKYLLDKYVGSDDGSDFEKHQINTSPSWNDL